MDSLDVGGQPGIGEQKVAGEEGAVARGAGAIPLAEVEPVHVAVAPDVADGDGGAVDGALDVRVGRAHLEVAEGWIGRGYVTC